MLYTGIYPILPLPVMMYLPLFIRFYKNGIVLLSCIFEPTAFFSTVVLHTIYRACTQIQQIEHDLFVRIIFWLARKILAPSASVSYECPCETAHIHRLDRAFPARVHNVRK